VMRSFVSLQRQSAPLILINGLRRFRGFGIPVEHLPFLRGGANEWFWGRDGSLSARDHHT
jgi:hypothetical protein